MQLSGGGNDRSAEKIKQNSKESHHYSYRSTPHAGVRIARPTIDCEKPGREFGKICSTSSVTWLFSTNKPLNLVGPEDLSTERQSRKNRKEISSIKQGAERSSVQKNDCNSLALCELCARCSTHVGGLDVRLQIEEECMQQDYEVHWHCRTHRQENIQRDPTTVPGDSCTDLYDGASVLYKSNR